MKLLILALAVPAVIYLLDRKQERDARKKQLEQKRRVRKWIVDEDARKLEEMLEVVRELEK